MFQRFAGKNPLWQISADSTDREGQTPRVPDVFQESMGCINPYQSVLMNRIPPLSTCCTPVQDTLQSYYRILWGTWQHCMELDKFSSYVISLNLFWLAQTFGFSSSHHGSSPLAINRRTPPYDQGPVHGFLLLTFDFLHYCWTLGFCEAPGDHPICTSLCINEVQIESFRTRYTHIHTHTHSAQKGPLSWTTSFRSSLHQDRRSCG